MWIRTIRYLVIQYVLGFLVNDYVRMDTYVTRDPCGNDIFTDINKAFYKCQLILKRKCFEFYNSQLPTGKKENPNKSFIYSHQKRQRKSKQEALY